jgi:zinc/manganese transport system permease protein
MVFSYLVIPAACAMLYFRSVSARLAAGWAIGLVVSTVGLGLSGWCDLPTGAAVVATFGLAMALAALARPIVSRASAGTNG